MEEKEELEQIGWRERRSVLTNPNDQVRKFGELRKIISSCGGI